MLDVMLLTWRHQRGALIGWSVAFLALGWVILGFYTWIGPEYEQIFESLPEGFVEGFAGGIDPSTPEGFLAAEYLSWIPLLFAVFVIGQGARAIAGEEEDGTIDILLSQPVTRLYVIGGKVAATVVSIFGLLLVAALGLLLGELTADTGIPPWRLIVVCLDLLPLVLFTYGLALLGSAIFHRRGQATLLATSYIIAAYIFDILAPLAPQLESLQWISIFYYAGRSEVLVGSTDALYWVVGLGGAIAFLASAAAWFHRKDLTT